MSEPDPALTREKTMPEVRNKYEAQKLVKGARKLNLNSKCYVASNTVLDPSDGVAPSADSL